MSILRSSFGIALASLLMLVACSDSDDSTKSGNNEVCKAGATCENLCDDGTTSCNMSCPTGATCKATCRDGQTCNFACGPDATCTWNCAAGTCNTSGDSADCTCSGSCLGTCGGVPETDAGTGGTGGSDSTGGTGGGGEDCLSQCGSPTDPGYTACLEACYGETP